MAQMWPQARAGEWLPPDRAAKPAWPASSAPTARSGEGTHRGEAPNRERNVCMVGEQGLRIYQHFFPSTRARALGKIFCPLRASTLARAQYSTVRTLLRAPCM